MSEQKIELVKISPLLCDLKAYKLDWLPKDLIAGLSVAAVQVPTAVAYAQLAGFSPEIGLYASILPVIVYAFLGSSRQLVVGPDAATCTMVASLVAPLAAGDPVHYAALSSTLSIIAGLLMVVGGKAKMGFIVNFFSRPILIGFLNGVAVSIIVGQMSKILGLKMESGDFIPTLIELMSRLMDAHWITLTVGLCTLAMLVLLKRFAPKAPSSLIALTFATLGLLTFGGSQSGVAMVGNIPGGLPDLALPTVSYHAGQGLLVSALGLVVVSFTSGMLTARSIAARYGGAINANQEMWAIGAANISAGLSGSFAITGADSRTAVNAASGNKTQLASVIAALATAAVAAWLSIPLGHLPLSALGAVLIFSAAGLMDFSSYKELKQIDPLEFRLSLCTTAGVLLLGVLPGVAIAIALALLIVLMRIYKPDDTILGLVPGLDGYNDVELSADTKTIPGVVIWRFEGPIVFFNADYFKLRAQQILDQSTDPRWLVLTLESITQLDATGLKTLQELQTELDARNIRVLVASPKTYMAKLRQIKGMGRRLREEDVFPTIHTALEAITLRDGNPDDALSSESRHSFKNFHDNLSGGGMPSKDSAGGVASIDPE